MNEKQTGKGIDWGSLEEEEQDVRPLYNALNIRGNSRILALAIIISTFSLMLPLYAVYLGLFGTGEAHFTRSLVVTLVLCWAFLFKPLNGGSWQERGTLVLAIDVCCVLLTIAVQIYVFFNIERWAEGVYDLGFLDQAMGITLMVLILEGTRRCFGIALTLLGAFFIIHTLFGNYFPGFFCVSSCSLSNLIDEVFISSNGINGLAIGVFLTFIIVFMLFGALVKETGAGAFFNSLATAVMGKTQGGPAKIAVLSSGFMATITGAGVANVATTGTVTIPLMKRSGLTAQYAGGVEAVASTGGQIMPPIMGVTAFVMASIIGVSYVKICISALVPACLYYLSLYFVVHFKSKKDNLIGIPKEQLPDAKTVLKEGAHLLIPFFVLSYMLIVGYTPLRACLWGVFSMFLLSFVKKETRLNAVGLVSVLESCTITAAPIGVACATIGIILGSIGISGLGFKFSSFVIGQAGGHLLPALIFCMIASIILGMGMPPLLVYISLALMVIPAAQMGVNSAHLFVFFYAVISGITPPVALVAYTAAGIAKSKPFQTGVTAFKIGLPVMLVYISLALMVIPAVTQMGVNIIAAHLFVFFYAVISGITPPVALVAYTAAGIAKSKPFQTGVTAFKIGLPVMIIPFMFAYSPELLLIGSPFEICLAVVSASLGIICFAAAVSGRFIKNTNIFENILLIATAIMLVKSGITTDLTALLILGIVILSQKLRKKGVGVETMAA